MTNRRPAPAIGLRRGERVDGTPFLHGIAGTDLTIPAGSRVSLRRVATDGTDDRTHVIVFAPPLPGISDTRQQLARARSDSLWSRMERTGEESTATTEETK